MPITEKQRHDLFTKFETTIGPSDTATLMELLPPVGWADVATKRDLEPLATKAELYKALVAALSMQTAVIGLLLALTR